MPFCIKCGQKSEPSAKFCTRCGNLLLATAASGTGSAQQPALHYSPEIAAGIPEQPAKPPVDLGLWLSKYKVHLFSAAGIIGVIWVINYLFFKPHPDKDGIAVANAECACEEKRMNEAVDKRKEILEQFNQYHFRSVYEVRQKIDSLDYNTQQVYNACIQQARNLHDKKMESYLADYNASTIFNQQYFTQKQLCSVKSEDLVKANAQISEKILHFSAYSSRPDALAGKPREAAKADTNVMNSPANPDLGSSGLTDDRIKNYITSLYNQENNLSSEEDVKLLLEFYEFPLYRYYDARNVNAARLSRLYSDSYFKSLSYHKVNDYADKMTISRQTDGSVKVIVGCRFEFSTAQSPDDKRSRNVFNVYVLTRNGKIKSVYQLL